MENAGDCCRAPTIYCVGIVYGTRALVAAVIRAVNGDIVPNSWMEPQNQAARGPSPKASSSSLGTNRTALKLPLRPESWTLVENAPSRVKDVVFHPTVVATQ
jgi:hypothetical protein